MNRYVHEFGATDPSDKRNRLMALGANCTLQWFGSMSKRGCWKCGVRTWDSLSASRVDDFAALKQQEPSFFTPGLLLNEVQASPSFFPSIFITLP
jgi:hypothetical protein